MAHGAPDWSKYRPWSVSYSVADLAEHAARSGSIVTYDRRGDVYFLYDFSTGWGPWESGHAGALGAQTLVPYPHLTGGYSVELTAGNDDNHDAYIEVMTPMLSSSSFGVCTQFSVHDVYETFQIRLIADSGTRLYDARVRHDFAAQRLEIYLAPATWYTIPVLATVQTNERLFNYLKLVVDVHNQRYDRLLFNDHEFDLKAHPLHDWGAGGWMINTVNIRNTGFLAQNDRVFVDNVILTQDEL